MRALGERVCREAPWVRIPPSPPELPNEYLEVFLFIWYKKCRIYVYDGNTKNSCDEGCIVVLDKIEVKIDKLVYGGEGLGRLEDGRAIFVPYCLPGEVVRATVREGKKHHVKADLDEIVEPSADRIDAKCVHFAECGGCDYQYMDYKKQIDLKKDIFKEQLSRLAKLDDPPIVNMIPSELEWNYADQTVFYLNESNSLSYLSRTKNALVPIKECHLLDQHLDTIRHSLDMTNSANIERIILRNGINDQALILFEGEDLDIPEMQVDYPVSIVYLNPDGFFVMAGDDHVAIEVLDRQFRITSPSKFHRNTKQAAQIVNCVLENLLVTKKTILLDLYCGIGLLSSFIAPRVQQCVGIEADPSACLDYAVNLDEFDNVSLYEGQMDTILPYLQIKPDVVCLAPPKIGLDKIVVDKILEWKPEQIIYISEDPATFSRDTKKLTQGKYILDKTNLIDMLPQTYQIVSVNIFTLTK